MTTAVRRTRSETRRAGWLAFASSVLVVGLIAYGSWVRTSGSGLGCPDWPLCEGAILPTLEGDTAIEFGHRAYAGITMLVVAGAAWSAYKGRGVDGTLFKILGGALLAISQSLPTALRVLHLGMATLIWWAVVTQWLLALRPRSAA